MKNEDYININEVAKAKGLSSNRSLRIAIQKGKYIAREITVQGGKSYEIKYSSLEVEIQEKLEDEEIKSKSTALVPINNINNNRINFVFAQEALIFLEDLWTNYSDDSVAWKEQSFQKCIDKNFTPSKIIERLTKTKLKDLDTNF